jgi:hypothetical protein
MIDNFMVEIRGLEPRTSCMPCKRSSQLSYIPMSFHVGDSDLPCAVRPEPQSSSDNRLANLTDVIVPDAHRKENHLYSEKWLHL